MFLGSWVILARCFSISCIKEGWYLKISEINVFECYENSFYAPQTKFGHFKIHIDKLDCTTLVQVITKVCRCRVANWVFLKPDFKILAFLKTFGFFGNKKSQTKSGFFQSERLGSGKTLSELHIHYKSLPKRVYNKSTTMQGAQNIENILLLL